jgi:hypothetical protein
LSLQNIGSDFTPYLPVQFLGSIIENPGTFTSCGIAGDNQQHFPGEAPEIDVGDSWEYW